MSVGDSGAKSNWIQKTKQLKGLIFAAAPSRGAPGGWPVGDSSRKAQVGIYCANSGSFSI